ncbi:MAG: VOC family protein, partial [Chitinophagaceae bacterium]
MSNIYPCLWFESEARAAADFYCSIFPNSRVLSAAGISVTWELDGNKFMAFNGGPHDTFNEAVSFMVPCKSQDEIDHYWNALTSGGGKEKTGGWCTDKFGVSWQIVPTILG